MGEQWTIKDFTVAYVMIKTELGEAANVANAVSALEEVHWAVVVTGPYDVIAGVKVNDNDALGELVIARIHGVLGVEKRSTATSVMSSYHKDGVKLLRGVNGPP